MPRKQLRPPIKLRKLMAPLIALCREKILTSAPQTSGTNSGDALITVTIRWPAIKKPHGYVPDLPENFPTGVYTERCESHVSVRHSVYAVLAYFKAKGYCSFDSKNLFAMRLPVLMRLAKLELKLDRLLEGISVDVEQQAQEMLDE
jgi:hypothetical protein